MKREQGLVLAAVAGVLMAAVLPAALLGGDEKKEAAPAVSQAPAASDAKGDEKGAVASVAKDGEKTPVKVKELTENIKNGVKWLVAQQNKDDGGWSQGEESANMGSGGSAVKDKSNVGDTCMAVMALLRTGSTPTEGEYAENIRKGITYVCGEIEKAKEEGLSVTSVNGTRMQQKLGPNIDTFMASLMLGETRNKMNQESRKRVADALDKVMDKIEKNTKADGKVAAGGWAEGIAQGVAVKGANIAAASGAKVKEETLKAMEVNSASLQQADGKTTLGANNAGVQLYATASNATAMQNTNTRLGALETELKDSISSGKLAANGPAAMSLTTVGSGTLTLSGTGTVTGAVTVTAGATSITLTEEDKKKLGEQLKEVQARREANEKLLDAATTQAAKAVQDDRFVSGFGSNGGEEFLSYLHLGEALIKKGGEDWTKWDAKISANLNNVQNKDGSWSGHHCITGRTFCTSAALLVLMIDREVTPVGEQIKKQ